MTGKQEQADILIGKSMAAIGASGLTLQWLTDFGSLLAVTLNILLAAGGLYLLYLRTKKARQDLRGE